MDCRRTLWVNVGMFDCLCIAAFRCALNSELDALYVRTHKSESVAVETLLSFFCQPSHKNSRSCPSEPRREYSWIMSRDSHWARALNKNTWSPHPSFPASCRLYPGVTPLLNVQEIVFLLWTLQKLIRINVQVQLLEHSPELVSENGSCQPCATPNVSWDWLQPSRPSRDNQYR